PGTFRSGKAWTILTVTVWIALVSGPLQKGFVASMIFATRREGARYTQRPAASVVVRGEHDTAAAVRGPSCWLGLPGDGSLPGQTAEATAVREVWEELARSVRLMGTIGEATQFCDAREDPCHFEMRAVFFLAEFPDEPRGQGEHEFVWLPLADTAAFFHESHAWAVRQALGPSSRFHQTGG